LKDRQRSRFSIFAEHQIKPIENLTLEIGATALFNSDWGWNLAPGADIGWQVTESLCLRGSVAQSFRIPSYTELFYNDRVTRDNPNVQPERAWTFELGGRWREGIVDVQASVFRRSAVQLIDYVRSATNATALWQAQNLSSAITNGADVHVSLITRDAIPILERLTASYTYLDPIFQVESSLQSRYVLDQLRHQAALVVDLRLFDIITNQWRFRYERRLSAAQDAGFVDLRLGWAGGGFEVFAEATNLLNAPASDFNGLPLPGRWLRVGGAVNLADVLR
jgi:iron complex outermembrane receptor protein